MTRTAASLVLFLVTSVDAGVFSGPRVGKTSGQSRPMVRAAEGIVVVISLDGFPARALSDPTLPVPTLRRLAASGALAAGMTVSNPSVTWPSHTSMVTGVWPARHGVLYNGMLIRDGPRAPVRVEPWRDKREMVHGATVYDLAYQAGLTTAQVDWVAIQNPGTISWAFPERPHVDGSVEREMIAAGAITTAEVEDFSRTVVTRRDQIWTAAALHIIKTHRPRLLLLHLLTLDSLQHRYGPGTPAASAAMAFLDAQVAQVVAALEAAGLQQQATLLIVSDHGAKAAPRAIRPNAVLRQAGLLQVEGGKVACDAYALAEGGSAMVYVTDRTAADQRRPRLKELFTGVEGIARVLEPADYSALGMPDVDQNPQMADLVLVAKDGYGFTDEADGEAVIALPLPSPGRHGYLSTDPDMNGIFIASGYGIRPGARLGEIATVDVAPTIAALLGLKMENVEGRRLDAILTPRQ